VNIAFKLDGVQNGGAVISNLDARAAVMHYTRYYSSSSFPVAPVLFFPDPSDWCPGGPFRN